MDEGKVYSDHAWTQSELLVLGVGVRPFLRGGLH